jgi:hypothetical protein
MSDLKKAAQQALEALKCLVETYEMGNTIRADIMDAEEAIASLKAALEQPEQELKPFNGLTKEEALAWARGLRADSLEYCSCGDRPKGKCPGEWELGCDLGNNPKYARRVPLEQEPVAFNALVAISLLTHLGGEVADYEDVVEAVRRLHALNGELLEALKNLEKEFRKVYPIYYYAEPWGHETNVPLQAARAAIAKVEGT